MLGALPPSFAGLEPDDSQEAASYLQPLSLEAGELIMEQGETDYTLVFISQGSVQLMDGDTRVGGATTRDMLGEVELFGQIPRVCSVVASGPVHLLVLAYEHYLELCERGNPVVYNLERFAHRRLADRLKWLNEGIAERAGGTAFELHPRGKGLLGRLGSLLGGSRPPAIDAAAVLAASPLFSWADGALLQQLAEHFTVERFEPETLLCKQGEVGDRMHVIAEGHVDVCVMTGRSTAETVVRLGPGDAFGDATLPSNGPRSASCVCHEEVVTLTMTREKVGALFAADDPLGSVFRQALLKNLIRQMLATQPRYVALEHGQAARVEDTIRGTPVSTVWRD